MNIALAKLELLVKELEVTSSAESERSREDLDKIKSLKQDVEVFRASLKSEASAKEMRILELQVSGVAWRITVAISSFILYGLILVILS